MSSFPWNGINRVTLKRCALCFVAASLASMLLAGCQTPPGKAPRGDIDAVPMGHRARAIFVEPGKEVEAHLRERYDDATTDCGTPTAPAFVCSGIMIRGTGTSEHYHSWDVNPMSPKAPNTSFSWLRKDAPHIRLAYEYAAGFIFYPDRYADHHDLKPVNVLCAFPIDGVSDSRVATTNPPVEKGCGESTDYPATSRPCQSQGITTAAAWRTHFDMAPTIDTKMAHQCGFTVAEGTPDSAAIFMQSVIAREGLALPELDDKPNELVLQGWPAGTDGALPIEAFFYVDGTADGKRDAQFIQRDFHEITGRWVAIVQITMPAAATGRITFAYYPSDQAIPEPVH